MPTRPTGTVTFLFSDIEGSTQRWEHQRTEMERAFARQEQIMREAIADNNGYAYKMIGDAFQAAFATAPSALAAALQAQRGLHAEPWGDIGPIRVRMALHTGITEERGDDYVGPLLNRVARLMSAGHGGQVLLTRATEELVREHLPSGTRLSDLGEYLLKDLVRPERVCQLVISDLPSDFPPLKATSVSIANEEPPAPGAPPFKGLQYFDEADADLFFGREQMTAQLIEYVRQHRFLAVIGASGSGKSSIVRAGLIPVMRREQWTIHIITPTAHPLEALATALTRHSESVTATATLMDDLSNDARSLHLFIRKTNADRVLLVVDQFEELFTLCRNENERRAFVDNLLHAVETDGGAITVIITLRADFYEHLAQYAGLREIVSKHQEYIGPMNADELRLAIEAPAKKGGWEFFPGLVDLLLEDVGEEPGALPLLSHALLETWKRRRGKVMTFKGYAEAGGVRGAIAKTAETVYTQELTPEQQTIARSIFLRLTELGEGTQDTRRRVARSELIPPAPSSETTLVETVLVKLADARLITTSEGTVEVAHEALIREWSRLREWLAQNREGLRLHRHLTEAAQEWERLGRDPGSLYRGTRLGQALEWADSKPIEMNLQEWLFLEASKKQAEQEEAEREQQRQRELEAARKLAETERRAASRLRQRAVFLAGTLLVALVLAVAAFWFAQQSNQNEQVAVAQKGIAETERSKAQDEQRIAFTRELAVNAMNNLDIDPERSILLALQAVSISTAGGKPLLQEAEDALHRAVATSRVQLVLRGHTLNVLGVAYSPDGKRIATASADKTNKIWDAATGKELLSIANGANAYVIAFSPDGKLVAAGSDDKTAKIFDATTGEKLMTFTGHTYTVDGVAFSPDGTRLATASGLAGNNSTDRTAKVWDLATGKELFTLTGHAAGVNAVTFSPDGKRIATAGNDKVAKIWDASTGKELLTITGHIDEVESVAFSPDGKRLVTGGGVNDGSVRVWDSTTGQLLLMLFGDGGTIKNAEFSPNGKFIVGACLGGPAKVWDATSGKLLMTLVGHTGSLRHLDVSPDGIHIATASDDFTVRVWDTSPAATSEWYTVGEPGAPFMLSVVKSPDGTQYATVSMDKTAKIWDAQTGKLLLTFTGHTDQVKGIAYSPDGKRVATISSDKTIKIWETTTGKELLTISNPANFATLSNHLAFSPDGQRLAGGGVGSTVKIWDTTTGKELISIAPSTSVTSTAMYGFAYSPDGQYLASSVTLKLFDAATGQLAQSFGTSTLGYDLAFSPDSKRLAFVSSDGAMHMYDVATGKELLKLTGHTTLVFSVAFSPDGTRVASGSTEIKVWNVSSTRQEGEPPLTLPILGAFGLTFSSDGKRLAAAGMDGMLHVYALPIDDIVAIAKKHATRALTTDECQKFLHVDKCP